jgi:hypothetical protein
VVFLFGRFSVMMPFSPSPNFLVGEGVCFDAFSALLFFAAESSFAAQIFCT